MKHPKIAIIGAGFVGSTTAYALLLKNIGAEIILIDINEIRCKGEILDLSDTVSDHSTNKIRSGTSHDAAQADIIIIAAGKAQKPGQTRIELFEANKTIFDSIFKAINPINSQAIVIVITNPVDLMTYYTHILSQMPYTQLFGSGTFLDTIRLRQIIATKAGVTPSAVEAYIIGEHGDAQVPVWSSGHIAGTPITQFPGITQSDLAYMSQAVKNKAYEIIACKGATYFGIAACIAQICHAIIFDQKMVMPLSTYIQEYDMFLSLPIILGESGIEKIISIPLSNDEQQKLKAAAAELRKLI